MKKLILITCAALTSIGIYAGDVISKNKEIKESKDSVHRENTICLACENGRYKLFGKNLVLEVDLNEKESIHLTNLYKCDHCQSEIQDREFKNGYFSISFPN